MLCVVIAGLETVWQSRQSVGCDGTFACKVPPCHSVAAGGLALDFDSAAEWQVLHCWIASCVEACIMLKSVPEVTSAFAASAIIG